MSYTNVSTLKYNGIGICSVCYNNCLVYSTKQCGCICVTDQASLSITVCSTTSTYYNLCVLGTPYIIFPNDSLYTYPTRSFECNVCIPYIVVQIYSSCPYIQSYGHNTMCFTFCTSGCYIYACPCIRLQSCCTVSSGAPSQWLVKYGICYDTGGYCASLYSSSCVHCIYNYIGTCTSTFLSLPNMCTSSYIHNYICNLYICTS